MGGALHDCGGKPIREIRKRFDGEMVQLLQKLRWWAFAPEKLADFRPLRCDGDLERVREKIEGMVERDGT